MYSNVVAAQSQVFSLVSDDMMNDSITADAALPESRPKHQLTVIAVTYSFTLEGAMCPQGLVLCLPHRGAP